MGITSKTEALIINALETLDSDPQRITVAELGAQNLYRGQYDYNEERGAWAYADVLYLTEQDVKEYMPIDLNGENGAKKWDLSKPLKTTKTFSLVTDFGTSEHVDDYYQCFANIHQLCKVGGIMLHENPKTGNWPQHGKNYVTTEFYQDLAVKAGYEILDLGEHPAMGNTVDGWNIFAVLRKAVDVSFIPREYFPQYFNA
jgi:hypothetical protein